ncbi:MAG: V-type ATP synthase subunit A [Candidatus Auribacterota bacterium]|nr:V-type ATP synthase subunit A [Candidatus Auribacterota bacterium]
MAKAIGKVSRVVGPLVEARILATAQMLELVYVGEQRLVGEIVKIDESSANIQVYEDTTGIKPDDPVYGSGMPLSVELGPGLLGTIYDGIQRPLEDIKNKSGAFIARGVESNPLNRTKKWFFKPTVAVGDYINGGAIIGEVQETSLVLHKVLLAPDISGTVTAVVEQGDYTVDSTVATVKTNSGVMEQIKLYHRWPVRINRPHKGKKELTVPLITGQRVIDTLFPIPKGGTVAVPGGFGTGKTMVQQALAKWCDADIIIFIGCGERGNEITDVLDEFPKLIDPRTDKPLMERTVIIANTSNMPVAAREASIYTGITMAEYYRDMGYNVAIMADSTSRWAEALRELSGRLEEMPADEGFPAYLPTRLAGFYERAGYVTNLANTEGSVTVIGSVSPPGGDFSEPVTQHTKRFVRAFWALDRQLANARHYPSISWINSYSEYVEEIAHWWETNVDADWFSLRNDIMDLLQQENKLQQVVKLVGPDVLPDSQRLVLETCTIFKNVFLQQNAFDKIDMYSLAEKQVKMLRIILAFHTGASAAIKKGSTLVKIKKLPVIHEIAKMKFNISNEELDKLDSLLKQVQMAFSELEKHYV